MAVDVWEWPGSNSRPLDLQSEFDKPMYKMLVTSSKLNDDHVYTRKPSVQYISKLTVTLYTVKFGMVLTE